MDDNASVFATIGDNSRMFARDEAGERVAALVKAANAWSHDVHHIETADAAAKCQALIEQVRAERHAVDEARIAEKRPHDEAAAAVQRAWVPLLDLLDGCTTVLNALRRDWLTREGERLRQEQAMAEAQAAERANAAALAQKAVESGAARSVEAQVEAQQLADAAAAAAEQAAQLARQKPQVRSELTGQASGLRTRWRAEIVDTLAALAHYQAHPKITAALQQVADADVRSVHDRVPIPGIKAIRERV